MGGVMAGAMGLGIVISLKDQVSKGLDYIKTKVVGLQGASQEMVDRFMTGAKQMSIGLGMMGAGAMVLAKTFSAPIAAAIKFESVMADVNKVANFTTSEFTQMSAGIDTLSKKVPVAAEGLAEIMGAAAQAGIAKTELLGFTEDAAKMGVAFGISALQAGDSMAGLRSIMGLTQSGVIQLGDAINHLSNNMNATAPDLLDFTYRSGGVGRTIGMTGQEVSAFGAAMLALKIPAEVASRAFNGLSMKLITADSCTKDAEAAFNSIGLSGSAMALAMKKDASSALTMFIGKVKESANPLGVLKSILGEGFTDEIAKLAGSNEQLSKALGLVKNEAQYAGSMLGEYATRCKTTENALQLLDNSMQSIKRKFGEAIKPAFDRMLGIISRFAEGISNLPKPIFTVLAALAGLVGVALILGGAVMAIAGAIKMWELSWTFLKIKAGLAMTSIKSGLVGVKAATMAAMLPMLKWAAIAALVYVAWNSNFMGIKDAAWAISEGFKMAVKASKDGIVEVDAATANALKKAGVWDFAVIIGRVFWRARRFCEGFAQGFSDMVNGVKAGWAILSSAVSPVLNTGKALLNALGLLDSTAKSNSDTWASWGYAFGTLTPIILTALAAIKAFAIAKSIFMAVSGAIAVMNAAAYANPIGAFFAFAIGVLTLFMMHWDAITAKFHSFVSWFSEKFPGVADFIESCLVTPIKAVFGWIEKVWAGMQKILGFGGASASAPGAAPQTGTTAGSSIEHAGKVPAGRKTPAAAALAGHQRTVTQQTGAAVAAAQAQNPPVVKNNVDVSISPQPVTLIVDGKQLGKTVARYNANERKREGKE